MQLTFTSDTGGDIYSLEVGGDLTLSTLKSLLERESSIPPSQQQLVHNMNVMSEDGRTLSNYNLKDGDIIIISRRPQGDVLRPTAPQQSLPRIDLSQVRVGSLPSSSSSSQSTSTSVSQPQSSLGIDWSAVQVPPTVSGGGARAEPRQLSEADQLWEELMANPTSMSVIVARNPPLGEALLKRDRTKFKEIYEEQQMRKQKYERDRIRLLNSDPFDVESQKKIADTILQENVEQNRLHAMEHTPESFGQVTMLYVDCKANKHPLKAFVDSGAQSTIMSAACAERCHLMHLVDRRFEGVAKGVGTQKIVGRVHLCQIQIGEDYLPCSFSILEEQTMDLLIGLDMLKRHQCCIDLYKNVLRIGTTGREVPFLPEGELPSHARLARLSSSDSLKEEEDRQLAQAIARSEKDSKK